MAFYDPVLVCGHPTAAGPAAGRSPRPPLASQASSPVRTSVPPGHPFGKWGHGGDLSNLEQDTEMAWRRVVGLGPPSRRLRPQRPARPSSPPWAESTQAAAPFAGCSSPTIRPAASVYGKLCSRRPKGPICLPRA